MHADGGATGLGGDVEINIKPGSYPDSINCLNKRESISVVGLTTSEFDALTGDHITITFEGASENHLERKIRLRWK